HLGLLADNGGPTKTIALQGGSVALDAGVDIVGVTTDQRGTARPQLNAPDIGAFELAPGAGSLVVTTTVDENNGTSDPNFGTGTSLREALIYAQSLGGAQTITFNPSLAGQTVTLTSAWNTADGYNSTSALRVDGNVTVQGPDSAPGIRLQVANASQLRHFLVGGSGTLVLKNVTVTGGKAMLSGADYGGAVWNFGNVTVRNCTFTGNTAAAEGGAIQSWGDSPSVSIENSSFIGNSSNGTGGALNLGASAMTLKHLTITNNTSPSNAVSLYKNSATMINTIIAGNSSDAVVGVNGGTFSPTSKNNLLATASAPGLTNGSNANQLGVSVSNLWLAPLALNGGPTPTVALQPGSIAIDAGVVIDGLTTDQRGTSRPQQDLPDVGAYELVWVQAAAPVINPPTYKHERAVLITITSPSPNTMIRYSVQFDSTMQDRLYTGPFYLSRTRTVYATAFGRGWLPNVNSANYAIDQPLAYWFNEIHPEGDYLGNMSGDGIVDLLKYAFNLAPQPGDLEKPNYR
ncbi:MAG TPA: choice-of-anchor Q domain-containing protein, partial [Chthoniobacterales bacterium]